MIDSCVEFLVAIHGHEPCAVNSTGLASTDVEPCSIVSLKSGISVTPPNLGSRCIALAKPTVQVIACDVDERLFLIVGFASVIR